MSNKHLTVSANKNQQKVIDQMCDQGFSLLKSCAEFDTSLGTVPAMERQGEKIYILPNGESCSEEEWQKISGEKVA
jgi:hypothetical protein